MKFSGYFCLMLRLGTSGAVTTMSQYLNWRTQIFLCKILSQDSQKKCVRACVRAYVGYIYIYIYTFTGYEDPEGKQMSSSTLSSISVLDGEGSQRHAPRNTCYPLLRRLGGPQSRSGQVRKISNPPSLAGFDPWVFQPVASRYIDWAIPVHYIIHKL